jgi:hypothetical protein
LKKKLLKLLRKIEDALYADAYEPLGAMAVDAEINGDMDEVYFPLFVASFTFISISHYSMLTTAD